MALRLTHSLAPPTALNYETTIDVAFLLKIKLFSDLLNSYTEQKICDFEFSS